MKDEEDEVYSHSELLNYSNLSILDKSSNLSQLIYCKYR